MAKKITDTKLKAKMKIIKQLKIKMTVVRTGK